MLTFQEAYNIVCEAVLPSGSERVGMLDALDRVLAEDVVSKIFMPPFNKSAMDGFACRKSDLDTTMEVVSEIPAGTNFNNRILPGQCARIMTGAMVPADTDFVLMKEYAEEVAPGKIRCTKKTSGENICYKGEDVKPGDVVLGKGSLIKPADIAILASMGHVQPLVYNKPSVAIISTGSELVEPERETEGTQIRNSNAYQLITQVLQTNIQPDYLGIVADDELQITKMLENAIKQYNVVIISGGVSVGDYDFVPKTLASLGVKALFHGMNIKPGKHLLFGKKGDTYVFGMPGNPVSAFVQFVLLVKPLLYRLMGAEETSQLLHMPIETDYIRKKTDTLSLVPVTFTGTGTALPLEYHGSAHILAYTRAKGMMELPIGISELKKGETVCVRLL